MNNKTKIFGITLVVILALAAVGAGVAFAQTPTSTHYGPGWMMNGYAQNSDGYGMMGRRGSMMGSNAQGGDWEGMQAMHEWMAATGGMHTLIWDALTETLGLTSEAVSAEIESGKTIAEIAEANGVSRTDLLAALETTHAGALAQAVTDGYLTQEQADSMQAQMVGRYEQMIDNTGYGMIGRSGQPGANGQFGAGGCHGSWNATPADQQP